MSPSGLPPRERSPPLTHHRPDKSLTDAKPARRIRADPRRLWPTRPSKIARGRPGPTCSRRESSAASARSRADPTLLGPFRTVNSPCHQSRLNLDGRTSHLSCRLTRGASAAPRGAVRRVAGLPRRRDRLGIAPRRLRRLDLASNGPLCYRPVRHPDKLPDRLAPAFENGNRVAGLPLPRYFPGHADGVLKVIGRRERIF